MRCVTAFNLIAVGDAVPEARSTCSTSNSAEALEFRRRSVTPCTTLPTYDAASKAELYAASADLMNPALLSKSLKLVELTSNLGNSTPPRRRDASILRSSPIARIEVSHSARPFCSHASNTCSEL